jgi:2-keto-3-deoxy-L-rhamnonate aldolase RhmA
MGDKLKKALAERQLTIGTWIQLGHPGIAEIFANAGFDWIAADCEHTDIDIGTFTSIARGAYSRGADILARVKTNDVMAIRQVLDAGAKGVIVPLVNTAEEARKAVQSAKFPPEGVRGFAYFRANNWGMDAPEYAKNANKEIVVVVMIESKEAVENIDKILSVDDLDGIFIGPYDMSASYGIVGQMDHPVMKEAFKKVADACRRHNKSAGMHIIVPTQESINRAIEYGFSFIALGMDTIFLDQSARNVIKQIKETAVK